MLWVPTDTPGSHWAPEVSSCEARWQPERQGWLLSAGAELLPSAATGEIEKTNDK